MGADVLLEQLDRVRRTGPDTWRASCPTSNHANGDSHPSLDIRETADGVVLLACRSCGCSAHEIVSAVGLRLEDLFPPRQHHGKPERRPFPAASVLRAVGFEALVVSVVASAIARGKTITQSDRDRVVLAAERLQAAITSAGLGGARG